MACPPLRRPRWQMRKRLGRVTGVKLKVPHSSIKDPSTVYKLRRMNCKLLFHIRLMNNSCCGIRVLSATAITATQSGCM
jgi:hypothetical protein